MIATCQIRPVSGNASLTGRVIAACRDAIAENEAHLCDLDCAIGDGDHGTNMRRGLEALEAEADALSAMPLPQALVAAGGILVMSIGGAPGPLYGTLLMEFGRRLEAGEEASDYASAFSQAVAAVARRGKCAPGEKTLLDVLHPVSLDLAAGMPLVLLAERMRDHADMTVDMVAMRGRASFLGERSRGHMDPGAASCALLGAAICRELTLLEAA